MLQIKKAVSIIKNNVLVFVLIILIIALSVSNINQYKSSLLIKADFGSRISNAVEFPLVLIPRMVLTEILDSDGIDETGLLNAIEVTRQTRGLVNSVIPGFHQLNTFLYNTEKDLKKLKSLHKEEGNEDEINMLIKKITVNQRKSLNTHEELRKLSEEYDNMSIIGSGANKGDILWYENSQGKSDKLIKIIEDGLK